MTPKQIADHLCKAMPDEFRTNNGGISVMTWFAGTMPADEFIQDWRTAGKCLEAMEPHKIGLLVLNYGSNNDCPGYSVFHNPRAICEAFCEVNDSGVLEHADADKEQPRTMCHKHGWYDIGPCKYCIDCDDRFDELVKQADADPKN